MTKRGLVLLVSSWVVGLALAFFALGQAYGATVERHAICWGHREKPADWHWDVWAAQNHRWKPTQRPCKRLWAKGWALMCDGRVIGVHRQRTLVDALPDPNAGEQPPVPEPTVIADNNTTDP